MNEKMRAALTDLIEWAKKHSAELDGNLISFWVSEGGEYAHHCYFSGVSSDGVDDLLDEDEEPILDF